ncbi:unnamed protein product [Peniophora sp. CBMAI 1063]|nr:unnamed protein product [Peniophora sp. CBMAI 1063]
MQATLSPFYTFGYSTHAAYEFSSDMETLQTRYATSSCRDEPPHDPTAPKYDPLGVLSKPAAPVWEKPVYTRTKLVVVASSSPSAADNTFTPRDPRAIDMAAAQPPHRKTLAWARDQGKVDQSLWALAALSLAHSPWADNYSHFWGEDVRADTARFVFGAGAHNLMRTTRRSDPPLHSDVDLYRDVVRAYKTWEESLKPSVAAPPVRTSPRVAQNKRKAVIAAAIETVEEAIEAQEAKESEVAPPTTKRTRTRTTAARKRAAGSPTHAPVISSPLAHSMLLPAAEIDATPAPTRASQRPKKKSQLARDAEEHAAAAAADDTRPAARRAASSSASSDVSSITATSATPSAPAMVTGKRSRSGSASSASTAVDVVAELAKSEERPAKKSRTTKQALAAPTPEPEAEDVSADQTVATEKASKSPSCYVPGNVCSRLSLSPCILNRSPSHTFYLRTASSTSPHVPSSRTTMRPASVYDLNALITHTHVLSHGRARFAKRRVPAAVSGNTRRVDIM